MQDLPGLPVYSRELVPALVPVEYIIFHVGFFRYLFPSKPYKWYILLIHPVPSENVTVLRISEGSGVLMTKNIMVKMSHTKNEIIPNKTQQ